MAALSDQNGSQRGSTTPAIPLDLQPCNQKSAQSRYENIFEMAFNKHRSKPSESMTDKIEPGGILIRGNVVVNDYLLKSFWNSGGTRRTSGIRVTHTWIKDSDGWRIMGGMSDNQWKQPG